MIRRCLLGMTIFCLRGQVCKINTETSFLECGAIICCLVQARLELETLIYGK